MTAGARHEESHKTDPTGFVVEMMKEAEPFGDSAFLFQAASSDYGRPSVY